MGELVTASGFAFQPGAEPSEADIAPIREKFLVVSRAEALVLGNRELFGRLAATAMLPSMQQTYRDWVPQLILREPCEYASVIAHPPGQAVTAQVAISLAEAEAASIVAAGPALEERRRGVVDELWASPYLTCFPESLDPSPFPTTIRYCHSAHRVTPATSCLVGQRRHPACLCELRNRAGTHVDSRRCVSNGPGRG